MVCVGGCGGVYAWVVGAGLNVGADTCDVYICVYVYMCVYMYTSLYVYL